MGLDTTHGCWSGAYSAFSRWRERLAEVCGIPLNVMAGFYQQPSTRVENRRGGSLLVGLPLKWELLKPDPLHVLLNHSECDGSIAHKDCLPLAKRLKELLPLLPEGDGGGLIGDWREKTQTFIDGLMRAHEAGEDVEFH